MDPALQLILLLVLLHVVEGAILARRDAVVFVGRAAGDFRPVRASPIGTSEAGLVFLGPLLPSPEGHVVDVPPFAVGEAVAGWPTADTPRGLEPLPDEVWAEGKRVKSSAGTVAALSSTSAAAALAGSLRRARILSPAKRAAELSASIRAAHDLEAIRARKAAFDEATRGLMWLGPLTLALLVGSLYLVFRQPWAFARWPLFALGALALLAHLGLESWSAHRRLFPERRGDRALKVALLVLSPGAAARARAFVGRDALAGFHPLAVGRVLLSEARFEAFAAPWWRAVRFPVPPEGATASARATFEAARSELETVQRALLEEAGLDPGRLEGPPEREGEDARAFCPRCHAQYAEPEGSCEDCRGVERAAFEAASAPGRETA